MVEKPIRRILMTADTIGGVWTYSLELMNALRPTGVHIAFATMGRRLDEDQRCEVEQMEHVDLYESDFRLEWMDHPWSDVAAAGEWLLEIADNFQPDLIHLNGYVHSDLPWQRPVLIVAHSCVYSWFAAVKQTPPPTYPWKKYHHRVAQGLAAATLVTAPSRAMLDALREFYDTPFAAGDPIYNGRQRQLFRSGVKEDVVLAAGRLWDDAKNIRVLAEASGDVDWTIQVAGDNRHPDGGSAEFPGLQSLGFLHPPDFATRLSLASIYALPARYEPFGLTALEAALAGCALVLSDIPSLREVWADAAIFVPPGDPAAWAAALNRVIRDSRFRDELAERAIERSRLFTPERMAQDYLRAYRTILTTHSNKHENSPLLSIAPVGLESRQRAFPPRLRHRAH